MDRTPIDGLTIRKYGDRVKELFDAKKVADPARPNEKG